MDAINEDIAAAFMEMSASTGVEESEVNRVEVMQPPRDADLFEDLFNEPRNEDIYNMGDLEFEWLDEEDIEYCVRVHHDFHYRTSIRQVRASIDRVLEDNTEPDIMKWLEASNELEIFCNAAAEAGRDVIDFDIEATEILDAVWKIMEDNSNDHGNDGDNGDNNNDEEDDENLDDNDEDDEEFDVEDDNEGPEYYKERM